MFFAQLLRLQPKLGLGFAFAQHQETTGQSLGTYFLMESLAAPRSQSSHHARQGQDHVSHRLVIMEATQREAVLMLYLVCCALGVVAMFLTQATIIEGYVMGGVLAAVALYALWRLEQLKV